MRRIHPGAPITVKGEFIAETGSDFETALRDFFSFGAPFTSPECAFEGQIDAPGGLGGRLDRAQVRTIPISNSLGENPKLHVEILNTEGRVLATADLDRVDLSQGTGGVRVLLQEVHHVFMIEDRYDLARPATKRELRFGDFTGEPVGAVYEALMFVSQCQAPNVGRVSVRHTPSEMGTIDPNWGFRPADDFERELK